MSVENFPSIKAVLVRLVAQAHRPADTDLEIVFGQFTIGKSEQDVYAAESFMKNLLDADPVHLSTFLKSPDLMLGGSVEDEEKEVSATDYFSRFFGSLDKCLEADEIVWDLFQAVESMPHPKR